MKIKWRKIHLVSYSVATACIAVRRHVKVWLGGTAIQTVGEGKQPMGGALGVRMEIVGAACAISG
jgi:hypothetical protein